MKPMVMRGFGQCTQLFRSRGTWAVIPIAVLLGLAWCLPPLLILTSYYLRLLVLVVINAIVALGLNLVVGVCGQINIGQAALVGTSGYVTAILVTKYGWSWVPAIVVALIVVVLVGLALGLISNRLRGPYLAVITLAFNLVFLIVVTNELQLTGGPFGIRVRPPGLMGLTFDLRVMYFVAFGCLLLLYVLGRRLYASKIGRNFRATRDDELSARCLGVNTVRAKIQACIICALYGGIAGILQLLTLCFIAPTSFSLMHSFRYLSMVVIGGIGYLPGSVIGAAVITVVPEYFRMWPGLWDVILGTSILAVLLFFPKGLGLIPEYMTNLLSRTTVEERWTGEINADGTDG